MTEDSYRSSFAILSSKQSSIRVSKYISESNAYRDKRRLGDRTYFSSYVLKRASREIA